ncbi:hypothetical protein J7M28_02030 [bacterium]|nr:hypothetical protein [bacterium]
MNRFSSFLPLVVALFVVTYQLATADTVESFPLDCPRAISRRLVGPNGGLWFADQQDLTRLHDGNDHLRASSNHPPGAYKFWGCMTGRNTHKLIGPMDRKFESLTIEVGSEHE